jgi:hypothetical protein
MQKLSGAPAPMKVRQGRPLMAAAATIATTPPIAASVAPVKSRMMAMASTV